jgi:hypothetical protein
MRRGRRQFRLYAWDLEHALQRGVFTFRSDDINRMDTSDVLTLFRDELGGGPTIRHKYAVYPSPFFKYTSSSSIPIPSSRISARRELFLVDGDESMQKSPMLPMLQPSRDIDVLLVNDNSADTSINVPNGSQIRRTYGNQSTKPWFACLSFRLLPHLSFKA